MRPATAQGARAAGALGRQRVEPFGEGREGCDPLKGGGRYGDADHPTALNGTTFTDVSPSTWSAQASMTGLRRTTIALR